MVGQNGLVVSDMTQSNETIDNFVNENKHSVYWYEKPVRQMVYPMR